VIVMYSAIHIHTTQQILHAIASMCATNLQVDASHTHSNSLLLVSYIISHRPELQYAQAMEQIVQAALAQ